MSDSTFKALSRLKESGEPEMEFEMVPRGEIEVKGKGKMQTYWLRIGGRVMLIATRHTMNIFAMPEYCWYAL